MKVSKFDNRKFQLMAKALCVSLFYTVNDATARYRKRYWSVSRVSQILLTILELKSGSVPGSNRSSGWNFFVENRSLVIETCRNSIWSVEPSNPSCENWILTCCSCASQPLVFKGTLQGTSLLISYSISKSWKRLKSLPLIWFQNDQCRNKVCNVDLRSNK